MKIDYDSVITSTDTIINNLYSLECNITKIQKKIVNISNVYRKIDKNTILIEDNKDSKLLFQQQILTNEHIYYKEMYSIIMKKYTKEIYDLSEHIVILLVSVKDIEIDNEQSKYNVYEKLTPIKKPRKMNYGVIKEMVNNTINNIKLIDEIITILTKYIESVKGKSLKSNTHNNSFELSLIYKKKTILLEYEKYCDKFTKTIAYFNEVLDSVLNQIETSKILIYFLVSTTTKTI